MSPPSGSAGDLRSKILVIDDSPSVRHALTVILSAAGMRVDAVPDPVIAIGKIRRDRPDAVVLDIEMPRMDGISFLRWLMSEEDPVPAIVCSGHAGPGTEVALQALEWGAVEIVPKPALGEGGFRQEAADQLVEAVRGAVHARVRRRIAPGTVAPGSASVFRPSVLPLVGSTSKLVAIGASTGGTEALRVVLERLPTDAPGLLIVLHMPEMFTGPFAERLDKSCPLEVREAKDGELIRPGRALIAPGNYHLAVRRNGSQFVAHVLTGPPVCRHRPSVDVLFHAVAQEAGPNAVGVLLTGMGNDGARGLLEMRQAGAHTIAQDEGTSVVFGMPKEAIALGAAAQVLPIDAIATAILIGAR